MRAEEIAKELELLEPIRAAVRRDRMIYQADEKRRVAAKSGIPFEVLADMAYAEWAKVRSQYTN